MFKIIICLAFISLVLGKSYDLAVNYLYDVKNKNKESSIAIEMSNSKILVEDGE